MTIKNKKAFTLIELIITIFIITIILTIITISFTEIRENSRNNQRVQDIQQMQLVLEKYYQENNSYPNEIIFGESLTDEEEEKIYLSKIPQNPNPKTDGICLDSEYNYETSTDNYSIEFCLGKETGQISAGYNCATPQGIRAGKCFQCESVITYEGYTYDIVQIGEQCWFEENLKYLPEVHSKDEFASQGINKKPAYGVYGYNGSDVATAKSLDNYNNYGVLYNGYAVVQITLCPTGWHIPTDTEWITLTTYLEGESVAGGKMKSTITDPDPHPRWNTPNVDATNSSGFTALPGGYRYINGNFNYLGSHAMFWSSTEISPDYFGGRDLASDSAEINFNNVNQPYGLSVRCLKD